MQTSLAFRGLAGHGPGFKATFGLLAVLAAIGGASALCTEINGHWVTGMNNSVPWGLPLAVATTLVLAASGALNIASLGSVLGQGVYKPHGRLSCLLAIALLAGGLVLLLLDLGQPGEVTLTMLHQNVTSLFSLNIFIYSGFFALVGAYLALMVTGALPGLYFPVATMAFLWRLGMTTGTGLIFGLLVSRTAFDSALMAPMFIALSLSLGAAVFVVVAAAAGAIAGAPLFSDEARERFRLLLIKLVAVSLYMAAVLHLVGLYAPERRPYELFILTDMGGLGLLLWGGFVVLGSVVPLALLSLPGVPRSGTTLLLAAILVILGTLALVYVTLIGAQVFPMDLLPGFQLSSNQFDGAIAPYRPSLPEIGLSLGGIGLAGLIVLIGARFIPLLPAGDGR